MNQGLNFFSVSLWIKISWPMTQCADRNLILHSGLQLCLMLRLGTLGTSGFQCVMNCAKPVSYSAVLWKNPAWAFNCRRISFQERLNPDESSAHFALKFFDIFYQIADKILRKHWKKFAHKFSQEFVICLRKLGNLLQQFFHSTALLYCKFRVIENATWAISCLQISL